MAQKIKAKDKGDQSTQVYSRMPSRYMPMEGGGEACVNSRSLNSFVPKDQLPEGEVIDVRYGKRGVKVIRAEGDAEKAFVANGRRHQMRLSAHMDSGNKPKRDQNGKCPSGPGILGGCMAYPSRKY